MGDCWLSDCRAAACQEPQDHRMTSLNIHLPGALSSFVDDRVSAMGFDTSSEYVCELIRKDQDRVLLRVLLMDGGKSEPTPPTDAAYFDSLRSGARQRAKR
jgi:antitoxin ParD1/3/4